MILPRGTRVRATPDYALAMFGTKGDVTGTVESSAIDPRDGIEYLMVHLDAGPYVMGTTVDDWRPL